MPDFEPPLTSQYHIAAMHGCSLIGPHDAERRQLPGPRSLQIFQAGRACQSGHRAGRDARGENMHALYLLRFIRVGLSYRCLLGLGMSTF